MNDTADAAINEHMAKIEFLKAQLISEQKESQRVHILNSEKDEDLNSARTINRELERLIKVCTILFDFFLEMVLHQV